ncbi:Mov34/MPN/PAD-1 family protein [Lactococcus cremoris]|uniref:Mov34/MPN/PAD-1 family protein n=1 Tax=Lactococcus TaxID=1357 RepID=UPI0021A61487|nr:MULTISPECIES: Mov34/MPN/PAD-1 family protein [Lactococcus]MCT3125932.1 hypothetical protein [Lactococcus lactis]MDA2880682.1 Mov34/MPN/PAD-1 family protein [Lactococcus cremoris]MDA2883208.1 Mov34/MPN/PAD-1 family protein [Lactococcus cremoris]WFB96756.1 Mov34/MPN/PAD-1 family protein [Lactococcus lactis]
MIENYSSIELMNKIDFPYNLQISENVIVELKKTYHKYKEFEVGGLLFGKIDIKNSVVSVEHIEMVKSKKIFKLSYIRSNKIAQQIIDHIWRKSDGLFNYLGEWHTHPNIEPVPSNTDKSTILKQTLEKNSLYFPYTILLIIGSEEKISLTISNSRRIIACTHIQKEE